MGVNSAASATSRPVLVDRGNAGEVLSRLLARAREDLSPAPFQTLASPAGIPINVVTNSRFLNETYARRISVDGECRKSGFTVFSSVHGEIGDSAVPRWNDFGLAPKEFHRRISEYGMRAAYPYRDNCWYLLDVGSRIGLQLIENVGDLPLWDFGAPLRQHLHWILQSSGMRLTHASALGAEGVGVLFLGNSGSGKSGITLAGIAAGLQTVGDDYVAISSEDRIRARSLFAIIKQDREGLSQMPELATRCATLPENWKGKVEISPAELPPGSFVPEIVIRAVLLPRITGVLEPRFIRCGAGKAMRALMRSNLHQYPGEDDDGMAFFGNILRRIPTYLFDLSRDFQRNGEAVKQFIGSL